VTRLLLDSHTWPANHQNALGAIRLGNWQLGGSEGFAMVKDADASGIRGLDRARIRLGCFFQG
jgi:hypothetical protein